jgi:hypothetical protein
MTSKKKGTKLAVKNQVPNIGIPMESLSAGYKPANALA